MQRALAALSFVIASTNLKKAVGSGAAYRSTCRARKLAFDPFVSLSQIGIWLSTCPRTLLAIAEKEEKNRKARKARAHLGIVTHNEL